MQRNTDLANRVWDNFAGRCIRCMRPAVCIHEIIPRSKLTDWDVEDNQVTLCNACHVIIHTDGALNHVDELRQLAYDFREKSNISNT